LEIEWEQVSEKRIATERRSFQCPCLSLCTYVFLVDVSVSGWIGNLFYCQNQKAHWSQSIRFSFTSYDCSNFEAKAKHLHVSEFSIYMFVGWVGGWMLRECTVLCVCVRNGTSHIICFPATLRSKCSTTFGVAGAVQWSFIERYRNRLSVIVLLVDT